MNGLTMHYPLTVSAILRRVEALFGHKQIVSRGHDTRVHRYSCGEMIDRAKRLAAALRGLGVRRGDRVATLAWNHWQHLEAYYAVPASGAVLHTLNLRLHPDDIAYIINDAEDQVLLIDESLLPLWQQVRTRAAVKHVIVMMSHSAPRSDGCLEYEELLASATPGDGPADNIGEWEAAAMCYTSGTTGRPKGVLYAHRALVLHSMACGMKDGLGFGEADTVLPVVPMFHANAWGIPYTVGLTGANLVLPGPFLDAVSLLELLQSERVTVTAGVPTVWMGVLQALDERPGDYDLSALTTVLCGGSAAPLALIRGLEERHGIHLLHAWGMTEMAPVGTVCHLPSDLAGAPPDDQYRHRAKQGVSLPLIEVRARTEHGCAPWDGRTLGELEVRGPWVASAYYHEDDADDRFTPDGWFRTGDVVTISSRGCVEIADRSKDLVKSGGEWISSVALENALMGHPAVAEAAVVAVPHPTWNERPLAVVAVKPGCSVTIDELRAFLEPSFAKWWLPDAVEIVPRIPRTAVGKFLKSQLRERFKDRYTATSI